MASVPGAIAAAAAAAEAATDPLVAGLQGSWGDDIGLTIEVAGHEARFSDRPELFKLERGPGGELTLRGAALVGTPSAPIWRFPGGVERRWARLAEAQTPEAKEWARQFHRYKGDRLQLWQRLCAAATAKNQEEVSLLKTEWEQGGTPLQLESAQRAILEAGRLLVPGVVFVHRKFGYRGVILGHEPHCNAPAQWQAQMGVPQIPGGRDQPFYHCLVDERDRPGGQVTFVAEVNVIPSWHAFPLRSRIADELLIRCDALQGYLPSRRLEEALWKQWAGGPFVL